MSICENCGIEHNGEYGSGRFCCIKCSRGFSTRAKRVEINKKVSIAIKALPKFIPLEKICVICGNTFTIKRKIKAKQECCSKSCSGKKRFLNEDHVQALRNSIRKSVEAGRWSGWKTRTMEPSYPEKYFITVFDNENIVYEREKRVGKWFIDFAIGKIAVEIDGKQHEITERRFSES